MQKYDAKGDIWMSAPLYPPCLEIAIQPIRNLKLNTSPITNFPSSNASLMQAVKPVKGSNQGKRVVGRQKLSWVEERRGEWQKAILHRMTRN
jgi:hypothetical protein